jgi:hypothetical protein
MSKPQDSFDFELTDFDEARRALEALPPGVGEAACFAPGYWEARRRKTLPSDKALTGGAIDWLLALPDDVRPKIMCDKFPRIVNQIAVHWKDRALAVDAVKYLLTDQRGGRRGFGAEVEAELHRLEEYAVKRLAAWPGNP